MIFILWMTFFNPVFIVCFLLISLILMLSVRLMLDDLHSGI